MKKTLSMLLAVLFALTAFGATTILGGVLGASAVFYDYYEYTQIPGFTAFTEADIRDHAWTQSCNFSGFSSDYKPEGVDKVANFTCTSPDQWGGMVCAPMELKNNVYNSWSTDGSSPLGSCIWGANMTLGGKDFLGNSLDAEGNIVWETSFEDMAGFCFWVGINGGHYDGSVKIQLFSIPCKGPAYTTSDDGSTDMQQYGTGFVYECDGNRPDEDGYVYFDFKTDFFQCDWWSKDDEGINHFRSDDPNKYPIPQSKIPYINGIQLRFSQTQSGDVISIGDWRMYFDTRIHVDELDEQCAIFDALDPEAYTEESYQAATEVYLEAYEMLQTPDLYTQKQVDAMAKELKHAISDLKPMFKAEKKEVKLAGFEVWDDDDFDEMTAGGQCLDTPAVEEEDGGNTPAGKNGVLVFANAVDGPPTYGWSLFTNATDDGAVKNPFELQEGSEPLSEAAGIRFYVKWDDSLSPVPQACRIGLGVSSEEIYFECEETAVELPETKGYVGVAWSNFYDVDGDEDIYDHIDEIDTIWIYLEGVSGIYYIADLTGFKWSVASADFDALQQAITDARNYMATLNETDWYYKAWDRIFLRIEEAEELLGTYGVTDEECDEAISNITYALNKLVLAKDVMTRETALLLEGLIKSAKTYWRGNLVQRTYMALAEELEIAERMIEDGDSEEHGLAEIEKMQTAIAGLIPIHPNTTVTSIHSFEDYTTRELNRANGDRTDGVIYELTGDFDKIPEGYAKALKMTATVDMGSETTDEHGMMQFKAMTRDTGGVVPIMLGPNNENTLIGDLTGTDGLCLWVGVNDMNLVQRCTMRVAVSNCTVGPLFERATVDIPIPANGSGWIYLPWEYFEYYDDWTHGQDIDLKKIYFYIMRFDGIIKQGLEVYITGIHAYGDVANGSWTAPVISNITEGQSYDVSEQDLIPDWDVGAAMLDGQYLIYGNPVTKNGEHELVVTNGDKSTTVHFTTTGAIEYEMPTASVEAGQSYTKPVEITWTPAEATAELDGIPLEQGDIIDEAGQYTLVVTNGDKVLTVRFTVTDEPAVKKGDFNGNDKIEVDDALAALRIAAKLAEETPESILVGDTDGDGHVTVADALAILRVAAKLADESSLG